MLGGPLERSGFPPPSGGFTPSRCGLFLLRRSQLVCTDQIQRHCDPDKVAPSEYLRQILVESQILLVLLGIRIIRKLRFTLIGVEREPSCAAQPVAYGKRPFVLATNDSSDGEDATLSSVGALVTVQLERDKHDSNSTAAFLPSPRIPFLARKPQLASVGSIRRCG